MSAFNVTWNTALVAEQLVALDQVDAEKYRDAVIAVLNICVSVLNQNLQRLSEHNVKQVLRVLAVHHEELGQKQVFATRVVDQCKLRGPEQHLEGILVLRFLLCMRNDDGGLELGGENVIPAAHAEHGGLVLQGGFEEESFGRGFLGT